MNLRAENILGGTLITLHWEQATDRVQSAVVLNANDCRSFAAAIVARNPYERASDLSMIWNVDRDIAQILIGTDHITIPVVNMFELKDHLVNRSNNAIWQFGASQT